LQKNYVISCIQITNVFKVKRLFKKPQNNITYDKTERTEALRIFEICFLTNHLLKKSTKNSVTLLATEKSLIPQMCKASVTAVAQLAHPSLPPPPPVCFFPNCASAPASWRMSSTSSWDVPACLLPGRFCCSGFTSCLVAWSRISDCSSSPGLSRP
jgi:hypothetical protein